MPTDTLSNMVRALRAECGHALSVAQGNNQLDTLRYLLSRTQIELWTAFVWPDIKIRSVLNTANGQYLYTFPTTMGFDQIREAWWAQTTSAEWTEVGYGINEAMIQGDNSNSQAGDPVQFWDIDNSTDPSKLRIWPTPQSVGMVRFIGNKPLATFGVNDTDRSTLDWTVIVLFTAAELLARSKAEDAAMKQQKAQRHLLKLLGTKVSAKMKVSTLGAYARRPTATPGLDYIPMKM
jgi:hypothetical protein